MFDVSDAIKRGVQDGMYSAFAEKIEEIGDCYDEPEDRCVMRPCDGCACMYARWKRLAWYKRMLVKKPPKPSLDAVQRAAMGLMIEDAISDLRIKKRKRQSYNKEPSDGQV